MFGINGQMISSFKFFFILFLFYLYFITTTLQRKQYIAHLCIFRCIVENATFHMDFRLSIACGRKVKNYALYFIANKTYFCW